jgi:putative endonuclease
MDFYVYILWSEQLQKYYVGSTNDLDKRLTQHNAGHSKFTSTGAPWLFIWSSNCLDRTHAFNLEHKIKKRGIKRYLEDNGIIFKK